MNGDGTTTQYAFEPSSRVEKRQHSRDMQQDERLHRLHHLELRARHLEHELRRVQLVIMGHALAIALVAAGGIGLALVWRRK